MKDKMGKDVNMCSMKDAARRCVSVHDLFGCYCGNCGFVKYKF